MERSCIFLAFLLLLQIVSTDQHQTIGVGIEIGIGGVRGGVRIGGGIPTNHQYNPPPDSKLNRVHSALQAWKSAITDDPNNILDTWVGSDVCRYKGVFCVDPQEGLGLGDPTGPIVAGIDLNHGNLKGSLVKELSLLSDISLLHLNSNRFTGSIPCFQDLYSLTELDLSNNQFSGPFPTFSLLIPNLTYLDLRFNNFSGPIPEDLFNKKLDAIFLNNNQFSGQIPSNLGNSPASVINLANNRFSGNIPFSFAQIGPRLEEILFLNNDLTGCIPEGIGLWQDLKVLDMSSNSLDGQLPDSLSCLSELEVLNLAHNRFTGVVSDLVCSLRSLVDLSVASNFFTGISHQCYKLGSRNAGFDFSGNCVGGKQRQRQRPKNECSNIPGLHCLRQPGARPIVCRAMVEAQEYRSRHSSPSKRERERERV